MARAFNLKATVRSEYAEGVQPQGNRCIGICRRHYTTKPRVAKRTLGCGRHHHANSEGVLQRLVSLFQRAWDLIVTLPLGPPGHRSMPKASWHGSARRCRGELLLDAWTPRRRAQQTPGRRGQLSLRETPGTTVFAVAGGTTAIWIGFHVLSCTGWANCTRQTCAARAPLSLSVPDRAGASICQGYDQGPRGNPRVSFAWAPRLV